MNGFGGFTQASGLTQGQREDATSSQGAGQGNAGGLPVIDAERTFVSLTVKQLLSAPTAADPSKLEVDGRKTDQMSLQFIGQIRSINKQSTNTTYVIDDSTGTIEAKRWGSDPSESFQQNQYVRVVGRVNIHMGKRSINAYKVFPVTDFNEVTCHFLQVIDSHIYATSGRPAPAGGAAASTPFSIAAQAATTNQQSSTMGGGSMDTTMGTVPDDTQGLNANHRRVLDAVKELDLGGEEGVSIDKVIDKLQPSGMPANNIKELVNFLAEEGHLYSTTDEEHFRATD